MPSQYIIDLLGGMRAWCYLCLGLWDALGAFWSIFVASVLHTASCREAANVLTSDLTITFSVT